MRQEIKQWTNRKTYAKMDKKRGMHCETRSACRPPQGNACLLVLFGHVLSGVRTTGIPTPAFFVGVERFLWSFHINLFMFLSGYVFRITGGATAKGSRLRFVGSKVIDLGFLYATFNCVLAFGIGTCLPALEPQKLPLFMRVGNVPPSLPFRHFPRAAANAPERFTASLPAPQRQPPRHRSCRRAASPSARRRSGFCCFPACGAWSLPLSAPMRRFP